MSLRAGSLGISIEWPDAVVAVIETLVLLVPACVVPRASCPVGALKTSAHIAPCARRVWRRAWAVARVGGAGAGPRMVCKFHGVRALAASVLCALAAPTEATLGVEARLGC